MNKQALVGFVAIFLFLTFSAQAKDFTITNRLDNSKKARVLIERTGASGIIGKVVLGRGDSKSFDFSSQSGGVRVTVYDDFENSRMIERQDFRGNEEVEIVLTSKDSKKWKLVRK